MTTFGIFGSGFGLYGYLPALCQCGYDVILPLKYFPRFEGRTELVPYTRCITWVQDEESLLSLSDGLVFAVPPAQQSEYIASGLARSNVSYLSLEKPLAPTPDISMKRLDELMHSEKRFRINYMFQYTDWAEQLKTVIQKVRTNTILTINWCFMAHHFAFDLPIWKRYSSTGGGALRYYGIHFIALLSEIGYNRVSISSLYGSSPEEISKWKTILEGPDLPLCNLCVDSRSKSGVFEVKISTTNELDAEYLDIQFEDPFIKKALPDSLEDRRVPFLVKLLGTLGDSFLENERDFYNIYHSTNIFWRDIERASIYDGYHDYLRG